MRLEGDVLKLFEVCTCGCEWVGSSYLKLRHTRIYTTEQYNGKWFTYQCYCSDSKHVRRPRRPCIHYCDHPHITYKSLRELLDEEIVPKDIETELLFHLDVLV